ncbi:hypothetical protein [Kitasatospora sp. NPDC008115]|uniref:hypothetical protein n=1 Tax=Kitasatospora sp. NPDC008115 TaxID=3364022 RepID=UPI0036E001D2
MRYDRTSVSHWLAGSHPMEPVPALLCEVLTRQLGRPVAPEHAGLIWLADAPSGSGDRPAPADVLAFLGHADPHRPAPPYTLAGPLLSHPAAGDPGPPHLATGPVRGRLGKDQLLTVEHLSTAFRNAEESSGGQLVGTALTCLLGTVTADWLRVPAAPRVRRELLVSVARLSWLAGFTEFDAHSHGRAQVYYRTAWELADEAADPAMQATALRALSVQAFYLGHHDHARDLAEAAGRHAHELPARVAAYLMGQQAVAAAGAGEHRVASEHLARTRRLLDRAEPPLPGSSCYDWAA